MNNQQQLELLNTKLIEYAIDLKSLYVISALKLSLERKEGVAYVIGKDQEHDWSDSPHLSLHNFGPEIRKRGFIYVGKTADLNDHHVDRQIFLRWIKSTPVEAGSSVGTAFMNAVMRENNVVQLSGVELVCASEIPSGSGEMQRLVIHSCQYTTSSHTDMIDPNMTPIDTVLKWIYEGRVMDLQTCYDQEEWKSAPRKYGFEKAVKVAQDNCL